MTVLLDTSVLVAAMIEAHPLHTVALPWLQRIQNGVETGLVAMHSLAEVYSILTILPIQPHIPPALARQLIEHNILNVFQIVSLSEQDYAELIRHLAGLGIVGGATYDALILHAAAKANVDRVVTFNEKHFRRVYPALADKIVSP